MRKENYYVLTGAMGAGKSTVLKALRNLGITCIDEPAREILAEQRSIDGNGVPEKDSQLFTELLLSRSIYQYKQNQDKNDVVIFDRGLPDNIGYAQLFGLNTNAPLNAGKHYQYNNMVLFLPAWEAIYVNDDERKMTYEAAKQFGDNVKNIYQQLGYKVIDVPLVSPLLRAKFIIDMINDIKPR